jgi:hypothetical protein
MNRNWCAHCRTHWANARSWYRINGGLLRILHALVNERVWMRYGRRFLIKTSNEKRPLRFLPILWLMHLFRHLSDILFAQRCLNSIPDRFPFVVQ